MSKELGYIKTEDDLHIAMQVIADYINELRTENQILKDVVINYNKDIRNNK